MVSKSEPSHPAPPRGVPPRPADPTRVLVVQDDFAMRMLARLVLEQAGHEVDEATNGTLAMRMIERVERRYDAILLDLRVGGAPLVAACAAALRPYTPVLVLTATAPLREMRHAAWLRLPIVPHELAELVASVIEATMPHAHV